MIKIKAQSALEYLMIVALALGVIVPTTYLFFSYSSESNTQIIDSQVTGIGRSIIDTAETVYFSGEGAKIVLELNMPKNVDVVYILNERELVFNYTSQIGKNQVVFFSSGSIPLTSGDSSIECTEYQVCRLADIAGPGLKKVEIRSVEGDSRSEILVSKFVGTT
ncbi:hypothetical protein KY347_03670 [Candidatus Woesearchaeota archaeon]|nr:hypothetical protein [Candidatus Woesearchaeota archaeon]